MFLVLRPVLGLDTRVPLPRPVGTSLTVGFGLLLLPLLPLLWLASRAPRR